ncbi:putative Cilia- and flagella-associated protein 58 [Paratrimastix pyriformis]|uniref:Cilia- and flagella-associated protein 58 n=1 Tax=Paratrimastix pyriformis TaxID=342808 RepID=A0ABQ8UAD3_9EUKA|nr:putative Cilia- and flagella-associated protein 58 [Paratrimastix pyriformis]
MSDSPRPDGSPEEGGEKPRPSESVPGGDQISFEPNAFETLEKDFHDVLSELVGDKSLERFRQEYEKLHRALKKSHESEKRLIKRCRELNAEIVSNAARVQTALKLSHDDANTIASLKKEIDRAFKMVNASRDKERLAKETIEELRAELGKLNKLVDQGPGISVSHEAAVNDLQKAKEELLRDREALEQQVGDLKAAAAGKDDKLRQSESVVIQLGHDIMGLNESIKKLSEEKDAQNRQLERSTNALKERIKEAKAKEEIILQYEQRIREYEQRHTGDEEKIRATAAKNVEEDQAALRQQLAQANLRIQDQKMDMRRQGAEINELNQAIHKLEKTRDSLAMAVRQLEAANEKKENEKGSVKLELDTVTKERDQLKKAVEDSIRVHTHQEAEKRELMRKIDSVTREKEIVGAEKEKARSEMTDVEQSMESLRTELSGLKASKDRADKRIGMLEKEKREYSAQRNVALEQLKKASEELKMRALKASDLEKQIKEEKTKLAQQKVPPGCHQCGGGGGVECHLAASRHLILSPSRRFHKNLTLAFSPSPLLQNLYESVRTERNLYSRNLMNAQEINGELRRKFHIMEHQVEQLSEEIKSKDTALVDQSFEKRKLETEKDRLDKEKQKLNEDLKGSQIYVANLRQEVAKLGGIISKAEDQIKRQREDYRAVMNERDILGSQLIRRNDELALLYEKIKIQQSTLSKGEISDLRKHVHILQGRAGTIDTLKAEILRLESELLAQQNRVRAMSEELESPMNVHRWKLLEGSDPETFELLMKIQTLQKRLISKTEEVVEKDLQLEEKEKLYNQLKDILKRQPGPQVAEQVTVAHHQLQDQARQMKAMAAELNMAHAQVSEYQEEIHKITEELQEVKKRYFEVKKREQVAREQAREAAQIPPPVIPQGPRFTGGGFSLDRT